MRTIELFSGTKSFSKVAVNLGYLTSTYDADSDLLPDICANILNIEEIPQCDFLWASPPCEAFSVAAIGKNWNKDLTPKHDRALLGMELAKKTIALIEASAPKYWFIENPRGMMRKMPFMELSRLGGVRHTVTYCQYGDTRMKPTDIWTNCHVWKPKPACKNGSPCHVAAPRGSRTGTQGIVGARDRGVIPPALFNEIFDHIRSPK